MAKKKRKTSPVAHREQHATSEAQTLQSEDVTPSGGVEKIVWLAIVSGVVAIFVVSPSGGRGHGTGSHKPPAASARVLEPAASPEARQLDAEASERELDPELTEIADDDEPLGDSELEGEEVDELEPVPEEQGEPPEAADPAKRQPNAPQPQ
jgi:hypothetical protein